jgi:hypothetical protein
MVMGAVGSTENRVVNLTIAPGIVAQTYSSIGRLRSESAELLRIDVFRWVPTNWDY